MPPATILVVGGAGYIGTHMVKGLTESGYEVVTLDDLSTGHRDLMPGGAFVKGDVGDAALLNQIFSTNRIAAVMHFAAASLVGDSINQPIAYYRNNVSKGVELLDAMRRHAVRRCIFSSSAAVYGEAGERPIGEDQPLRPTHPYGATKQAIEQLLGACDRAHGIKHISLRYFNAAGADPSGALGERHEPETHLIPRALQVAAGAHPQLEIHGTDYATPDGTCVRDYVHVTDLVQAHLLALDALLNGADSDVYNLGNARGHSVREVIEMARKVTGEPIPVVEGPRRTGDPAVLVASSKKARDVLGWKPQYESLKTIIDTAWAWHQQEATRTTTVPRLTSVV